MRATGLLKGNQFIGEISLAMLGSKWLFWLVHDFDVRLLCRLSWVMGNSVE